jgi:hypothetical protein
MRRDIEIGDEPNGLVESSGRNLIAVIGIDHYQHWRWLGNAVHDAEGASKQFQQLGFAHATVPLLDDRATGKAMWALVTHELKALGADDSLVLFYAGHGATQKHRLGDDVVKTGYLIPVDAEDEVFTWVDLEGWLRAVALLPAKHILVILDACHSGIALDPIIKWRDKGSWRDEPLSMLNARRSRRIITAALDDQVALDSGPMHGHSLFTGCLIEGLRHDLRRRGVQATTGSELGLYVQKRVESYPHSRQTPDFGTFAFDDRGEMVIPLPVERRGITADLGNLAEFRDTVPDVLPLTAPATEPLAPASGDQPESTGTTSGEFSARRRQIFRRRFLPLLAAALVGGAVAAVVTHRSAPPAPYHSNTEIDGVTFTKGTRVGQLLIETTSDIDPDELAKQYANTLEALRIYIRTKWQGSAYAPESDHPVDVLLAVPASALCEPTAYFDRQPPKNCAASQSAIGTRGTHRLMVVSDRAQLIAALRGGVARAACEFSPVDDEKTLREVCKISNQFVERPNSSP